MERRQDIVRSAQALDELLKLNKNGLDWTLRATGRSAQIVNLLKLIHQYHLAVDLKRLAAFATGFQVQSISTRLLW